MYQKCVSLPFLHFSPFQRLIDLYLVTGITTPARYAHNLLHDWTLYTLTLFTVRVHNPSRVRRDRFHDVPKVHVTALTTNCILWNLDVRGDMLDLPQHDVRINFLMIGRFHILTEMTTCWTYASRRQDHERSWAPVAAHNKPGNCSIEIL